MQTTRALVPEDLQNSHHERRSWHRAITASALATLQRSDPADILRAAWPRDDQAALILRAAQSPTSTEDFPAFDKTGLFQSLSPSSAAVALFERGLKLDLRGVNTISIPNIATWEPQPIFVTEGGAGPNVQWGLGSTTVGPTRKILIMAATTAELENATPEAASAIIGRLLADASNKSIDTVAFGTAAADDAQPAGLLHGVAPLAAVAAGPDAMAEDLGGLIGAIGTSGIDSFGAVFVCSPREATVIKTKVGPKFDHPVLSTLGLPAKTVACFALPAVASGYQDAPQIETSRTATVHFEDDSPVDIVGSGGAVALPTKTAFQTDLISIRVRARAAWAVTPGGAQVINNVNW
ncbi:hypothetical protein [Bradyrhizobium sp. th.b2]|uniref:hypothetical protein n=1 Tax=Bradyrhizobium sp. th-b2 TaxID=172088 RepID=UPI0012EB0EBE|nr:hypothetical protein [Bradyrhizobium sp. th.b2]